METVNPGEKETGQIERPDLDDRFKAKLAEKQQTSAENITVAQRLTRRARQETIEIPFNDDLGEFFIEMRLPTTAELDEILDFQKKMTAKTATPEEVEAYTEKLYQKMGELCVDPSLDANFFRSGHFLGSDFGQLIKEILFEEERRISQASSFRKKPARN